MGSSKTFSNVVIAKQTNANLSSPDVSLDTLLGYLLEKMGTKTKRLKEIVEEWITSME